MRSLYMHGFQIGGNPGVSGGVCSASLEMSSDQVQNEIQAIDSILKALSTGGYSMSSMGRLSELTSGADVSVRVHDIRTVHSVCQL